MIHHPTYFSPRLRILLLGATGFIGANIARRLDALGVPWLGVSRHGGDGGRVLPVDDVVAIRDFLRQGAVVINASGGLKPGHYHANFERAMNEFWQIQQQVLEVLRLHPPQALVQVSSAGTVYGGAAGRASSEQDPVVPESWYGRSKVLEEGLLGQYAHNSGIRYACARVSNPFGKKVREVEHGLIDVILARLNTGMPLLKAFHPEATRDFIHAPAMAEMIIRLAIEDHQGVFNVGFGRPTALSSLFDLVEQYFPNVLIEERAPKADEVVHSQISTRKIDATLGYPSRGPDALTYLEQSLQGLRA